MLQITCSMVSRMLDFVLELKGCLIGSAYGKKNMKPNTHEKSDVRHDVIPKGENKLSFLSSLLDLLLLKKNIENRSAVKIISVFISLENFSYCFLFFLIISYSIFVQIGTRTHTDYIQSFVCRTSLIGPLFKLLRIIFSDDEWTHGADSLDEKHIQASSETSRTSSSLAMFIEQTVLLILEDISVPLTSDITLKVCFPFIVNLFIFLWRPQHM